MRNYGTILKIISYFCIVKRFDYHFIRIIRTACLAVSVMLTTTLHAAHDVAPADTAVQQRADSVEISLLTCSGGSEVWSLYGHTALRVHDLRNGDDIAVNYGMFNFRRPNFILRFVFGLTDYEMGIAPFQMFMMEYASEGRGVTEQRLNLSTEDKSAILSAIAENYMPSNRTYRYNYFYDNCTTRARDMITTHLVGQVEYADAHRGDVSYRSMIHQFNEAHRWARFGNDLLLGVKSDAYIDAAAQQFLPATLMDDFARAAVVDAAGHRRPLVGSTHQLLEPNAANQKTTHDVWDTLTPRMVCCLLLFIVAVVTFLEYRRRKTFWLVDVTLLTLDGLAGLVLLAMVFSQHPTVSLNFQILVFNPLSLVFVYSVGKSALLGRSHFYWNVLAVCIVLFFFLGFFQKYAEGMWALALCLLLRVVINRLLYRKSNKLVEKQ